MSLNHADVPPLATSAAAPTVVSPPLASTVLSPQQITKLAAAVNRIVPPDGYGPGGAEGGALAYILRHLEDGGNLASFRADYHAFLDSLDADGFESLSPVDQDAVLTRTEKSGTDTGRFFRQFAEHAQEGYYTTPENWPGIGFVVTG